jgi:hypothetical protein
VSPDLQRADVVSSGVDGHDAVLGSILWNRFGRNLWINIILVKFRFIIIPLYDFKSTSDSKKTVNTQYSDKFLYVVDGWNFVQIIRIILIRKVFGRNGALWNRSLVGRVEVGVVRRLQNKLSGLGASVARLIDFCNNTKAQNIWSISVKGLFVYYINSYFYITSCHVKPCNTRLGSVLIRSCGIARHGATRKSPFM